jgi:uracil-DNA glycosylase family 4
MDRLVDLNALYDEIHAFYGPDDRDLVRRRTVPEALQSRVVLLGQAPGRDTQRLSGLPYCFPPPERPTLSRGGQVLDAFLARFGYSIHPGGPRQYAYHTDLVHYFPGRRADGKGDLKPSAEEIARSQRWLETEISLVQPAIVIALGRQPAVVFLQRYGGKRIKRLVDVAGMPLPCEVAGIDVQLIAIHHPSGAFQHPAAGPTYGRAVSHVQWILASSRTSARRTRILDT